MNSSDIVSHRLINQQLRDAKFKKPQELISWMGAMQAQDFGMAKWAIGLRLQGLKDGDVEKAFNEGKILRTHVLRPTWHFVTPKDIRWMIELAAPHIFPLLAYNDRRVRLSNKIVKQSNDVLAKALQGQKHLTRDELKTALQKARIATDDLRFIHIMIHAELDGIICSGPRKGKQFTYTLINERAPKAKLIDREEALAELVKRYFTSHGPATLQDFSWWSGLPMTDVKKGMEMVKSYFKKQVIEGRDYFFKPSALIKKDVLQSSYLLPNYDEYTIAYKDRSLVLKADHSGKNVSRGNAIFNNTILINGKVEGTWQRTIKNNSVVIETNPFLPFSKTKQQLVMRAAKKYSKFLGMTLKGK
ncbi:MAG TPA: winged helix DNA-binding domain-containing protein [Chitinophagaceae bacterium]|jgi:hypothetical protein|nr:winged helix DNA-binding domain-containing protein [Chitinophagaceae bacterium]